MQSLFILGRQPALGLAELESLFGTEAVQKAGTGAALVDIDHTDIDFDRLGGATRFGRVLTIIDSGDWKEVEKFLIRECPKHAEMAPPGKMTIGLSAYGFRVSPPSVQATALSIKKAIKKSGRPVRIVPNKETELSTAQVLHNGLTSDSGWELFLVKNGERTIMAQTTRIQDIESYTVRDRERPMRDARVGMLPPKLAQIIINLAVGHLPPTPQTAEEYMEEEPAGSEEAEHDARRPIILDPFCGTGVLLQESLLTGYGAYGTDIDKRMVEYSQKNMEWLKTAFEFAELSVPIEVGDATKFTWTHEFTHVACETYLGRPFTSQPHAEVLHQTISECNIIVKKFLKNISSQIPSGTRLCLAVPAWQIRKGQFKHLPLLGSPAGTALSGASLDSLGDMGYNRISFEHASDEDLLYYREDQVVARELLVLTRK